MHKKIFLLTAAIFTAFCAASTQSAFALTHLEGDEAKNYVGDPKTKFGSGRYIYEILKRKHRDSMNGRNSDAVIFTDTTDRLQYRKRADGDHHFVIGDSDGRVEDPVETNATVWNPIQNTLRDDHPHANVFLDDNGDEIAVIYTGRKTRLTAKLNNDNLLEVKIKIKQVDRGNAKRIGALR